MTSYLIQDTTKQEREQIVRDSLGYCDLSCDEGGASFGYDMYQPYIDGEMELSEISRGFRASYIIEHDDLSRNPQSSCVNRNTNNR